MSRQTKQQAALHHLGRLAKQPHEQARYALEVLERERGTQVVSEALAALSNSPVSEGRSLLLRLYAYYDEAGVKRDAGGNLRIAILSALLAVAEPGDRALAERAVATYEFLPPGREECAGGLRAAGLVFLSRLDSALASFHCARLLLDVHTSRMSGEPATSAIRILARQVGHFPCQGHLLPLYSYLFAGHEGHPEVEAECLRHLAQAPADIVQSVLSHYTALVSIGMGTPVPRHETKGDVVLLGLLDLVLASPDNGTCLAFLEQFLRETQRYDVYHSVLATIIATHSSQLWKLLLKVAHEERRLEKIELLLSALTVLQHDPQIEHLIRGLQQKQVEAQRAERAS